MFLGLNKLKLQIVDFVKNVKLGIKYLGSLLKREPPKQIITLSEKSLKSVDQALLEDRNKWMGLAVDNQAKYKQLYRKTLKKVEVNPLQLLKEQKKRLIEDVLERGQKIKLKDVSVYTKDLRHKLGKFVCFSICDGYWHLIYEKDNKELDMVKAPSLEELVSNASSISNQVSHNLLITNFIYIKGELIRVPPKLEKYV